MGATPDDPSKPGWFRHLRRRAYDPDAWHLERDVFDVFASIDWSATRLGALETWPTAMSMTLCNIFGSSTPIYTYWTTDLVCIYNAAGAQLIADRHPAAMGKTFRAVNEDLGEDIVAMFVGHLHGVMQKGKTGTMPMSKYNVRYTADLAEAVWLSWETIPVFDEVNWEACSGVICRFLNHSKEVFQQRRVAVQRDLDESLADTPGTDLEVLFGPLEQVFGRWVEDFPIAILLSRHEKTDDDLDFDVKFKIGFKERDHDLKPLIDLALKTSSAQIVRALHDDSGDGNQSCIVCPIRTDTRSDRPPDFILILKLNLERRMDDEHASFAREVASQCAFAITKRCAALAVSQSEARFRGIVDNAPIGISLENSKTRQIHYANQTWLELMQLELPIVAERFQQKMGELLHPSAYEPLAQYNALPDTGKQLRHVDVRFNWRWDHGPVTEEDQSWGRVTTESLPGGEIMGICVNVSDAYNEQRRLLTLQQIRLETETALARAAEAEKTTFRHLEYIDYLAHELRGPTSALTSAIELSTARLQDPGPLDRREMLDDLHSIHLCAQHMRRVMDDTLLFSQLQAGKLSIFNTPSKLEHLVAQAAGMFRVDCATRSIRIVQEIDDSWQDLGCDWIETDPNRLSQVLLNLITNSLKFAPDDGTGVIKIRIAAKPVIPSTSGKGDGEGEGDCEAPRGDVRVVVDVIDNGKPMTDVELSRLFQRFAQANTKTHVETGGGTGLGLHICATLVRLLGGDISASRNDLGGTTFTFSITASRTQPPQQSLAAAVSPGSLRAPENFGGVILLVEDNLVIQKLVRKQLAMAGYQVAVANNGLEALHYFESPQGEAVVACLCDIDMPTMDGYETVRRVKQLYAEHASSPNGVSQSDAAHVNGIAIGHRERRWDKCPPFIAVSANARPEQIDCQLKAGHDATLSKPFSTVELLEMVSRMTLAHGAADEGGAQRDNSEGTAPPTPAASVTALPLSSATLTPHEVHKSSTTTGDAEQSEDRFDREAREWDANPDIQLINAESAKAMLPVLLNACYDGPHDRSVGERRQKRGRILELGSGTGLMPFSNTAGDGTPLYKSFEHWVGVDTSIEMCRVMDEKIAASASAQGDDTDGERKATAAAGVTTAGQSASMGTGTAAGAALSSTTTIARALSSSRIEARNLFLSGPADLLEGGEYFDFCVSTVTFHHIANMGGCLRTLHGCVRRGVVIVDYLHTESSRSFHPEDKMDGVERHGLDPTEITHLCEEAGFTKVKVERPFDVELMREGRLQKYPFLLILALK